MKNISIWANKSLMIMVTIIILGFVIVLPGMIFWAESLNGFSSSNDEQIIEIVLGFGCIVCALLASFVFAPNAYERIEFSENYLKVTIPFKKTITKNYECYKYIYKAYYLSYGIPHYYIILSSEALDEDILSSINNVKLSHETIKIMYNEKNYQILLEKLSKEQVENLEKEFKSMRAPKVNFIL